MSCERNASEGWCAALLNGTTQVIILGAGFDPLSLELHREFPSVKFWEIDHPATQRYKVGALPKIRTERLHFIASDLSTVGLDEVQLIKRSFDPAQATVWVAEGLLMYLPADIISSMTGKLKSMSTPGSQFAFTFMEKQSDGRTRFDSQSKLVDWWLRRRGEPFLWGTTRSELAERVGPWRVIRFFDHDDLRVLGSGLTNEPIARGEVICLAEI
jgi:methyltransferase (TIGR00027 family)